MQALNLKSSLQYLKGVGPERAKVLARLGLRTVGQLLHFYPRRHEIRFPVKRISELEAGSKQCVRGIIAGRTLIRTRFGQMIFRAVIREAGSPVSGSSGRVLFLMFFKQPYLLKIFTPKSEILLYGTPEVSGKNFQMTHPEFEIGPAANSLHMGRWTPIYPLTEDLSQKGLRQLIFQGALPCAGLAPDPLASDLKTRLGLVGTARALMDIHFPSGPAAYRQAYRRLVFDEFFWMQLRIQLGRAARRLNSRAVAHQSGQERFHDFLESLPVTLTASQQAAIEDIVSDMRRPSPMNRLVQGDVGSGKTFVAAAALFFTAANDCQGAIMAPTEALAQQLYFNLSQWLEPQGVSCAYLGGDSSLEEKRNVLEGLLRGEIQVVCGTHALIQAGVTFKNLGLVIVDEQHKFGVFQREALKSKGRLGEPHRLLMTATPIPRTLSMTLYGDLDVSVMSQRPQGRKAIHTLWVGESRRKEIYTLLDQALQKGGQGYVLCPLVEESENTALKSVLASHQELARVFSDRRVGFLHGRMKASEKKKMMQDFKDRKIQLLVSTVVIEVGIDVPNANFMIIENAERFGLAQLHQLRGRVGRGEEQALCVLFSDSTQPETIERLQAFQSMTSGFDLAEKDLEIRGSGDLTGERQHGFFELKIGDFSKDMDLLLLAKKEAEAIALRDPKLALPEHKKFSVLLKSRFKSAEQGSLATPV